MADANKITALQFKVNELQNKVNELSENKHSFKIHIDLDNVTQFDDQINETLKSKKATIISFEVSNGKLVLHANNYDKSMYSIISTSDISGYNYNFSRSCNNIILNRKYCFNNSKCILFARQLFTDNPWYITD